MERLELNAIVYEMDLDSAELDEKLSEIVSELYDEFDKGEKGYLELEEFGQLVKKHSKKSVSQESISDFLETRRKSSDKTVDKFEFYDLLYRPGR